MKTYVFKKNEFKDWRIICSVPTDVKPVLYDSFPSLPAHGLQVPEGKIKCVEAETLKEARKMLLDIPPWPYPFA